MRIIDITGPIYTGMWSYEPPYPEVKIEPISFPDWLEYKVYSDLFIGICSQTGTYLETPAHYLEDSYPLIDVPLEELFMRDTAVINLPEKEGGRQPITVEELEAADVEIREGDAILVGTGWGRKWRDPDFLSDCPYITYDAMMWLIDKKPFLLGGDSPRWDHLEKPQGFWDKFFRSNILLLAPVINLEKVSKPRVKLVVLPLKVEGTCATPCRAILIEE